MRCSDRKSALPEVRGRTVPNSRVPTETDPDKTRRHRGGSSSPASQPPTDRAGSAAEEPHHAQGETAMDAAQGHISRRLLLGYGAGAIATAFVGGSILVGSAHRAAAGVVSAELFALDGERTMIDGLVVPFAGFGSTPDRPELPSGQLEVQTGDTVTLTITNRASLPIGFTVPGVPGANAAPVAPRQSRTFSFTAPPVPGTFFYVGTVSGSADTGRALGATGAMVVLPRGSRTSVDSLFPGVRGRAVRQKLFGRQSGSLIPAVVAQERTWLFAELNPATARDLAGGRVALPSDPEPEYFLINELGGMLAVEDVHTNITGSPGGLGQPGEATLVRMINTGRAPPVGPHARQPLLGPEPSGHPVARGRVQGHRSGPAGRRGRRHRADGDPAGLLPGHRARTEVRRARPHRDGGDRKRGSLPGGHGLRSDRRVAQASSTGE